MRGVMVISLLLFAAVVVLIINIVFQLFVVMVGVVAVTGLLVTCCGADDYGPSGDGW